jgi:hypothetical protein
MSPTSGRTPPSRPPWRPCTRRRSGWPPSGRCCYASQAREGDRKRVGLSQKTFCPFLNIAASCPFFLSLSRARAHTHYLLARPLQPARERRGARSPRCAGPCTRRLYVRGPAAGGGQRHLGLAPDHQPPRCHVRQIKNKKEKQEHTSAGGGIIESAQRWYGQSVFTTVFLPSFFLPSRSKKRVSVAAMNVQSKTTLSFLKELSRQSGGGFHSFRGQLDDAVHNTGIADTKCDNDEVQVLSWS